MIPVPFQSRVPGLTWPGLPGPAGARALALHYQLSMSERWPAAALAAAQFRQLETLIAHSARHIPFWRDRLRNAGIRPGKTLTADLWRRLPILTRKDVQTAGEALFAPFVPPEHGTIGAGATTGSTGMPLKYRTTELAKFYWQAFNQRSVYWHGMDPREKVALIRHGAIPPEGDRQPDWGPDWTDVMRTGPTVRFHTTQSPAALMAWLLAEDPAYLLIRPSALGVLARHCRHTGQRPRRLRQIQTIGEVVSPDVRALCQSVFGVPIVDVYSAEEAGILALQCPEHEHYHLMAEGALVEVLDAQNRPCDPGQIGRVVVSHLHNFAMPLLRYELGDYAERGPPCPCGRHLPVLTRILGRARDQVTLPDGTQRFFSHRISRFHEISAIIRFQLVQLSLTQLQYRLVAHRPLTAAEEAQMRGWLHQGMDHKFDLSFTYVDDIPRGPGGKFQDFLSLLPQDQVKQPPDLPPPAGSA